MKMLDQKDVIVTNSRFAMWRAAIALAWANGRMTNSEATLIHDFTQRHNFSESQIQILDNDSRNGISLDEVFDQITEARDRAHLINFSRVLFDSDDNFDLAEQNILAKINDSHAQSINLPKILGESRTEAQKLYSKYEAEKAEQNANASIFEQALDYIFNIFDDED